MFLFLSAILVAVGVLFALCFSGTLALAHGSLDWPYSPSPGLGAASRPAKLPRLPFTDSPDGSLGRKRDYRDGDSQRRSQSAPTPHSSWLSGITAKVRTGGLFRFARSEEHTSELQSRFDLVCRLLLEKKNIMLNV